MSKNEKKFFPGPKNFFRKLDIFKNYALCSQGIFEIKNVQKPFLIPTAMVAQSMVISLPLCAGHLFYDDNQ